MKFRFILYLSLILALGGCGGLSLDDSSGWRRSTVREIPVSELQHQQAYTLAPEDVLLIHAWGVPEFESSSSALSSGLNTAPGTSGLTHASRSSSGVTVDIHGDGSIDLPLIGTMKVSGDTVEQTRQRIVSALSRYVAEPRVGVTVLQYRSRKILVLGEVKKPGVVVNPGPRLSLAEALAQSGSIDNITANREHVYVIRGVLGQARVSMVDLHTAIGMFKAQNIWLKRRDVVYVGSRWITDWNRFISQVLPSMTTAFLGQSAAR